METEKDEEIKCNERSDPIDQINKCQREIDMLNDDHEIWKQSQVIANELVERDDTSYSEVNDYEYL